MHRLQSLFAVLAALAIAATLAAQEPPAAIKKELGDFRKDALAAHDKFLASDLLEGRGPGTRGDEVAMEYIADEFESYGLKPAGDSGTYFQKVPLVGVTMDAAKTSVSFTKAGAPTIGPLKHLDQYVATDQSQTS